MKEFSLTADVIAGAREKPVGGIQHMSKAESLGIWKRFLNGLKASFEAPFKSDLEKKPGLHWQDWGKL